MFLGAMKLWQRCNQGQVRWYIYNPMHPCVASEHLVRSGSDGSTISNGLGIDGAVSDRLGERSRGSRQVINLESLKKLEDGFVVVEIVINCIIS
ncbi:unnamed protein product [Fusarium graminearum]|nr:unnamed protein product [Fusarium graminearum]